MEICSSLIGRQRRASEEPLLPEERTRAHWSGHLIKASQRAGFCRSVRSRLGSPPVASTLGLLLVALEQHCFADPSSHRLFWGLLSSNQEQGAEHQRECSLRWDLVPLEGGPERLPLPKLSAKAPELSISAEDNHFPLRTWSEPLP